MRIFKNLAILGAFVMCFASCSKHTTCSAYSVNHELNNNHDEGFAQNLDTEVESL